MTTLTDFFAQTASPLTELRDAAIAHAGIRLLVKRDDLLHPETGGNKWRKLKYNLLEARKQGRQVLATFGGAYSNHIAAVAAAGKQLGFGTIGFIRGEAHHPLNPTLARATQNGMQLHYLDRETYRHKTDPHVLQQLLVQTAPGAYVLPEGGSNQLALRGCAELVQELPEPWDYICCPAGTGASLAGLAIGAAEAGIGQVLGFSALKGSFLQAEVEQMILECTGMPLGNWRLFGNYHFGGYAKVSPGLLSFVAQFEKQHGIPLEPVYTAKMFFGIYDLIRQGYFPEGSTVVAWHTGGLQGLAGLRERGLIG